MRITLAHEHWIDPDFTGWYRFFVEAGHAFDLSDYCDAFHLDPSDVDPESAARICEACKENTVGWIAISHEQAGR